MNQGLFGFPMADTSDIGGIKRAYSYRNAAAPVPGMPVRTYGVWYYNDTGEDMQIEISTYGNGGQGGSWLYFNTQPSLTATPQELTQLLARPDPSSGYYGVISATIPPGYWYTMLQDGAGALYSWAEHRRYIR